MSDVVRLIFDRQAYGAEALQKAAYRGLNYFTVDMVMADGGHECSLVRNSGVSDEEFTHAVEEFRKDALDYQLRLKLAAETEPVRNLILGIAFSRTGFQGSGEV